MAGFVFGEGQIKPYLHVYGVHGELLTNPGVDAAGRPVGHFPHHRGIFIGWKIQSELGSFDLWHMNNGGRMIVAEELKAEADMQGAMLQMRNEWHAGKQDRDGNSLLLTEWRTLRITGSPQQHTLVDAEFTLRAARDLKLAGDLQHSGVHFRAADEVHNKQSETVYLHDPADRVNGEDLKWVRFWFPIGAQWYSAAEMNAPENPVEQLSIRNYGRFGFFFKQDLARNQTLRLRYRFLVRPAVAPPSPLNKAEWEEKERAVSDNDYSAFLESLRP